MIPFDSKFISFFELGYKLAGELLSATQKQTAIKEHLRENRHLKPGIKDKFEGFSFKGSGKYFNDRQFQTGPEASNLKSIQIKTNRLLHE